MRTLIVIPARLESTRLPRKLLLAETGKPLICHVYRQAAQSKADEVFVITDAETGSDDPIYRAVKACYPHASVASSIAKHPNGTSRAAEAYAEFIHDYLPDDEEHLICIVQGDVPDISPTLIDQVIDALASHPEWDCATAGNVLDLHSGMRPAANDKNKVKMWVGDDNTALNFSRDRWQPEVGRMLLHIGIYAYRRDALLRYAAAGPCEREQAESLEQLRALHIGLKMGVVLTDEAPAGIDTREDYDAFVARWKSANPTLTPQPLSAQ